MQQSFGKKIEAFAKDYLISKGLKFVINNYHSRFGELDLIMRDQDVLVFVEVRYRKKNDYGDGVATVTQSKQNKIKKTATCYLQEQNLYDKVKCRFDVIGVSGDCVYKFNWIKDAFWDKW